MTCAFVAIVPTRLGDPVPWEGMKAELTYLSQNGC